MRSKILFLILNGLLAAGLSAAHAEGPDASCKGDSVASIDNSAVTYPYVFTTLNQPAIPVNEGEIRAGLLYDAVNQKIVWQKNMNNAFPIASLTKMMVALLTVEDIKEGKFTWTDNIKWTRETVVGRRHHRRKIYTNVSYSLLDVFKASMIASNNECAEQMARYIGNGDLQATIDRMNVRAKALGMFNTYYGNPTGLPAPHSMFDNSSSPSDLLLLTMEMLKYNEVLEISAMGYAAIENGKSNSIIRNHNHLTIDFSGEVDGLKTGYTKRAGFCLVATTAKCDHRLVSIVLGCRGPQIRNELVRDMVNDYYSSIALDRLGPNGNSPLMPPADNLAEANTGPGRYVIVTEPTKKTYVVKRGENLSTIAAKNRCSLAQLKSWNKKTIKGNHIVSGQRLAVYVKESKRIFVSDPVNGNESEDNLPLITDAEKKVLDTEEKKVDNDTEAVVVKTPEVQTKYLYHVVAPGDTLFNIANRYQGTTVEEIKTLNKITDSRNLKPGTKLKVKVQG